MDAAIARAVGIILEADFPDRAELLFERRHHVALAEAVGHQPEHRVFRQLRRALAGIGDEEAARAAQGRLSMAQQALVAIVPGAQAVGVGMELGKERIELAEPVTWEPSGTSAQVSQVDSNWPARRTPSLNNASSLAVMVAPVVGFGLITAGCGIWTPRY